MKNSLARTALALASLALATSAHAQFKISVNGRDITDDPATTAGPAAKPSVRLILPEGPLKPGTPFEAELLIKGSGRFDLGTPVNPGIRWENGDTFNNTGTSAGMTVRNGVVSSSVHVGLSSEAPLKPGTYKIPATTFNIGSATIEVPEHTMTVRELAPGENAYEKIGCTIESPPDVVFPGQIFPMKLVLTETEDERILNLMDFKAAPDAQLTLSPVAGKAEASEITVNGNTRRRIVIPLIARTLVADDLSSSADLLLNIAHAGGDSGPRRISVPLRVRSAHAPEAGKPASYRGAIGSFTVSPPEFSVKNGKAGDPARLTFGVTGEGSIDRVVGPELTSPDWSIRPENSTYARNPDGSVSKTFAYTLTPLYGGNIRTPASEFSWFDPSDMKYHTAAIPAQTIPVEGPPRPPEKKVESPKIPVLAADPSPTGVVRTYGSLFESRTFIAAQLAALAGLVATIFIIARRRRIAADPVLVKRIHDLRLLRSRRRAARRALSSGDHGDYASRARAALRAAAALDTTAEADALTGAETLAALPGDAATRSTLAPLFAHEESLLFAGAPGATDAIKGTSTALFATLAKAENRKR